MTLIRANPELLGHVIVEYYVLLETVAEEHVFQTATEAARFAHQHRAPAGAVRKRVRYGGRL